MRRSGKPQPPALPGTILVVITHELQRSWVNGPQARGLFSPQMASWTAYMQRMGINTHPLQIEEIVDVQLCCVPTLIERISVVLPPVEHPFMSLQCKVCSLGVNALMLEQIGGHIGDLEPSIVYVILEPYDAVLANQLRRQFADMVTLHVLQFAHGHVSDPALIEEFAEGNVIAF